VVGHNFFSLRCIKFGATEVPLKWVSNCPSSGLWQVGSSGLYAIMETWKKYGKWLLLFPGLEKVWNLRKILKSMEKVWKMNLGQVWKNVFDQVWSHILCTFLKKVREINYICNSIFYLLLLITITTQTIMPQSMV